MTNAWHLAVDFGTSNTAAAHQSPMGRAISALALTHRSNIMPSAVFLDAPPAHTLPATTSLRCSTAIPPWPVAAAIPPGCC